MRKIIVCVHGGFAFANGTVKTVPYMRIAVIVRTLPAGKAFCRPFERFVPPNDRYTYAHVIRFMNSSISTLRISAYLPLLPKTFTRMLAYPFRSFRREPLIASISTRSRSIHAVVR